MATIIDTDNMVKRQDDAAKLAKRVESKRLNILADKQVDSGAPVNKEPPKIKFADLKRVTSKRKRVRKAPVINIDGNIVNEYVYSDFAKTLETIVPSALNHCSFNEDAFKAKLAKSKDIKHFLNEKVNVTNDFIGAALAVVGIGLEHYLSSNGVNTDAVPSRKRTKENTVSSMSGIENKDPLV